MSPRTSNAHDLIATHAPLRYAGRAAVASPLRFELVEEGHLWPLHTYHLAFM